MGSGQTVTGKYERKIRYLDYMENGVRTKGAGFVRLERWDDLCGIDVQINGLYRRDHFTRPFLLLWKGQERELCRLEFGEGGSKLSLDKIDVRDMDGQGLPYEELAGFRIPVSEGKEIRCVWGDVQPPRESETERASAETMLQASAEVKVERDAQTTAQVMEAVQAADEDKAERDAQTAAQVMEAVQAAEEDKAERDAQTAAQVMEAVQAAVEAAQPEWNAQIAEEAAPTEWKMPAEAEAPQTYAEPDKGNVSRIYAEPESFGEPLNNSEPKAPAVMMREEKWEQLQSIYPHIFPFQDEREYLSMSPADFVILPRRYYKLVSNSFLLHGFYNYDHLILARMEQQGTVKYYIGVPGNYYEREKRVAVLFGFQSFECESELAKEGDFGYYMIPVEL